MTIRTQPRLHQSADAVEQGAAEWVIRLDGDGSPDVERAFEEWLDASPRHRAAFLRIGIAWRRADRLKSFRDPAEEPDLELFAPERASEDDARAPVLPARPPEPGAPDPSSANAHPDSVVARKWLRMRRLTARLVAEIVGTISIFMIVAVAATTFRLVSYLLPDTELATIPRVVLDILQYSLLGTDAVILVVFVLRAWLRALASWQMDASRG